MHEFRVSRNDVRLSRTVGVRPSSAPFTSYLRGRTSRVASTVSLVSFGLLLILSSSAWAISTGPTMTPRGAPVSVALYISPAGGGSVTIGANTYYANQTLSIHSGTYAISETPSASHTFLAWGYSGGVTIAAGKVSVTGAGAVYANFSFRPTVQFVISQSICGPVTFNGTTWANGSAGPFPAPGTYSSDVSACAGFNFQGWGVSPAANGTLSTPGSLSTSLILKGNITLTASFVPRQFQVLVQISPPHDGQVAIGSSWYTNGSHPVLNAGVYSLSFLPYSWSKFVNWSVSTNLSITGSLYAASLTVRGNGTLYISFVFSPQVTLDILPYYAGQILLNGTLYSSGSVVPLAVSGNPYNISGVTSGFPSPFQFQDWVASNETLNSTVSASTTLTVTGNGTISAYFEPLPLYTVQFVTNPLGCGSITLNGTSYTGGQSTVIRESFSGWPISATPCTGYSAVNLTSTGAISIVNSAGLAYILGNGTIWANFTVAGPWSNLTVEVAPTTCGTVSLVQGGVTRAASSGTTLYLPDGTYTAQVGSCAGYHFAAWSTLGSGVTIAPTTSSPATLTLGGNGTLYATFAKNATVPYTVKVYVTPSTCGPVQINGVNFPNGTSVTLQGGIYPVSVGSCSGMIFTGWNITGTGLSLSSSTSASSLLDVAGNGTVTARFAAIHPTHFAVSVVIDPSGCPEVSVNNTLFGNGSTVRLFAGSYPLGVRPCPGRENPITTGSGGVSILNNGFGISVVQNGTIYVSYPQYLARVLIGPSNGTTSAPLRWTLMLSGGVMPFSVAISYGNGITQVLHGSGPDFRLSEQYNSTGSYALQVYVSDSDGTTVATTLNVTIQAPPPSPAFWQEPWFLDYLLLLVDLLLVVMAVILIARSARRSETTPARKPIVPPPSGEASTTPAPAEATSAPEPPPAPSTDSPEGKDAPSPSEKEASPPDATSPPPSNEDSGPAPATTEVPPAEGPSSEPAAEPIEPAGGERSGAQESTAPSASPGSTE